MYDNRVNNEVITEKLVERSVSGLGGMQIEFEPGAKTQCSIFHLIYGTLLSVPRLLLI